MPKMKTHKGVRKRFKLTASGKVKRTKACHQKYALKKSGPKLQKLRRLAITDKTDAPRIVRLLKG